MKFVAAVIVAISGLSVALPQMVERKEGFHDLTTLKYANSVPIAEINKHVQRDTQAPTKDNRALKYTGSDKPKTKTDATFDAKVKQEEKTFRIQQGYETS